MQTEETRALIQQYYGALGAADHEAMRRIIADDVVWQPPETAPVGKVEGIDRLMEELAGPAIKETYDFKQPFDVQLRSMIVDGNKAVVQQRVIGTARQTGGAYDNQYCWIYTCEDGQIVHMEEYADTLLASRVMGWDV